MKNDLDTEKQDIKIDLTDIKSNSINIDGSQTFNQTIEDTITEDTKDVFHHPEDKESLENVQESSNASNINDNSPSDDYASEKNRTDSVLPSSDNSTDGESVSSTDNLPNNKSVNEENKNEKENGNQEESLNRHGNEENVNDKLANRNNNPNNQNNTPNNRNNNPNNRNNNLNNRNQPHVPNYQNRNSGNNVDSNIRKNNPNKDDVGSQKLRNSLSNKAKSLLNRKKNNSQKDENSGSSSDDNSSSNSEDGSSKNDFGGKRKRRVKLLIIKLILIVGSFLLLILFLLIFLIAILSALGFDVSVTSLLGIKTYETESFQPTYEKGTEENKNEIEYYKKLDTVSKDYYDKHKVELKNGYIHALLIYYYHQADVIAELQEKGTSIDYKKMINLTDKIVDIISSGFNNDEIDYEINGRLYNAFKNSSVVKDYYSRLLKDTDIDSILKDIFEIAKGIEEIEFTDDTVITEETKVTVSSKGTETTTAAKTLTINEYIADSIYANSNNISSSEEVKAYTIAYSTNLASQNKKLSIDSNNVTASNSLCSVSLGCSYDENGDLISGAGAQSSKNTQFYNGGYYYKLPLNSSEVSNLNNNINSVFGNVLVNSDGTYPTLDTNKINGSGNSYQSILNSSYGNLQVKNIGEDSYILDGSYGTEKVQTKVHFYDQNDYGGYTFCGKKKETIKTSGCGVTSMAIIVSTYENNSKYNPVLMMGEAHKTGYCGGGIVGTSPGFFKKEANTMNYKYYQASKYSKKDLNLVLRHLSQGHLVIAHMSPGHFTSGGHYIVLGGVDPETKKVYVYDPYDKVNKSYRKTGNGWYDFNSIIVKEAWNFYVIWKG